MVESRVGIAVSFVWAFFLQIFFSLFFSASDLHFFIAPLLYAVYASSFGVVAPLAFMVGLFLDSCLVSPRLGFFALSYLFSVYLCFQAKKFLFKDLWITLPIMAYCFSVSGIVATFFLAFALDCAPHLSLALFYQALLYAPMRDVAAAFLFFSLPHIFYKAYYKTIKKRRMNYL